MGLFGGRMGLGAIDDLIDIVDGFFLAGAAPENEDAGHQVEVRIVFVVGGAAVGLFFHDQAGDADGLGTMAAKNAAEILLKSFYGHRDSSLDSVG